MLSENADTQVRAGTEGDLEALAELYNHYVRETAITFDTEPFTPEQRLLGSAPTLKTARIAFWLLTMSKKRRKVEFSDM